MLYTEKSRPTLAFSDAATGKTRVFLSTDKEGPKLVLSDATGQDRTVLGTGAAETPDGKTITYPESTLMLFGPDGTALWKAP